MALAAGQKVQVRVWLDRSVHVYRKDKPIKAHKILKKAWYMGNERLQTPVGLRPPCVCSRLGR